MNNIIHLSLTDYITTPHRMIETFWSDINNQIDKIVQEKNLKRIAFRNDEVIDLNNDSCPLYIKCCQSTVKDKNEKYYRTVILIDDFEKLINGDLEDQIVRDFLRMHRLFCGV